VQLSEVAAAIEKAGKEGNLSYVKARHEELMNLYNNTEKEAEKMAEE